MGSYSWIKVWHEVLHDPKMGKMSDRLWRRAMECFLIAGEYAKGGELPTVCDMSWTLRCEDATLEKELEALASVSIVECKDGVWRVVNFEKRQGPVDVAERKAESRKRGKKQDYYDNVTNRDTECHDDVTNRDTEERRGEEDKEEEEEEDSKTAPASPASSLSFSETPKGTLVLKLLRKENHSLSDKYDTVTQRDGFLEVFESLNGELESVVKKGLEANVTTKAAMLSWLRGCVRQSKKHAKKPEHSKKVYR